MVKVLAVDLIDILRLCESDVLASEWRASNVECMGDLASEFMRLGESKATVGGKELLRLASGVYQVIWGDFEASRPGEEEFWLLPEQGTDRFGDAVYWWDHERDEVIKVADDFEELSGEVR